MIELPVSVCPTCGAKNDAATCISEAGAMPKPGDVSMCAYCGQITFFRESGLFTAPKPGELEAAYAEEPGMQEYIEYAQRVIAEI